MSAENGIDWGELFRQLLPVLLVLAWILRKVLTRKSSGPQEPVRARRGRRREGKFERDYDPIEPK